MITITTKRGIIELPCPPADDAETIKGNCGHGNPLLGDCKDCDLIRIQMECEEIVRRAYATDRRPR